MSLLTIRLNPILSSTTSHSSGRVISFTLPIHLALVRSLLALSPFPVHPFFSFCPQELFATNASSELAGAMCSKTDALVIHTVYTVVDLIDDFLTSTCCVADEIIKRKLLIEGDGGNDDRRISSLLKTFLKWCDSSETPDERFAQGSAHSAKCVSYQIRGVAIYTNSIANTFTNNDHSNFRLVLLQNI